MGYVKKRKRGKPFTKNRQPPNKSKQVKKKKTILREAVGLESWDSLKNYLLTKGVKKFIDTLDKLTGKSYTTAYLSSLEFVKAKISRTELTGEDGKSLNLVPSNITTLTFEQLLILTTTASKSLDQSPDQAGGKD